MWAKIEVIPSDQRFIELPLAWSKSYGFTTHIRFGGRVVRAGIRYRDDLEYNGISFEQPCKIILSHGLRDELLMPEPPVYQMTLTGNTIVFGPVIGLLLGDATHRYNPIHMEKYSDRFGVYPEIGGVIYAFSPKFINWREQTTYGLYYNHETAQWEYGRFPLPQVIYRRDFHTDPHVIKRLVSYTGGRLFNSYRFTKYELYDFIKPNRELGEHLPPTEYSMEYRQLMAFINRYQKVILKPIHLSRGRGICVIEKIGSKYVANDFRCKHPMVYELYDERFLEHFFDVYQSFFDKYLIQKYIRLAKIDGAPFDIRVVMQKQRDHTWGTTGIECRVSNNGYLTNISRGGYALHLDEALRRSFPGDEERLAQRIDDLCYAFCQHMDTFGEHFAEFGLDIAVDTDQRLWIIEANVFPSFKGFKRMDYDVYLDIRHQPMYYAASLASTAVPSAGGEVL
jgi:glutathione synthase/RimK-type ligase-like ATP-grasp enzyme